MNRNLQRKNVDIGGGVTAMSGGKIGDMTSLTTSEKSTLVGAVNEVNSKTTTVEQIREVMQRLPDGSAVSAQVALNKAELATLGRKVGDHEGKIGIVYTDNPIANSIIKELYLNTDEKNLTGKIVTNTNDGWFYVYNEANEIICRFVIRGRQNTLETPYLGLGGSRLLLGDFNINEISISFNINSNATDKKMSPFIYAKDNMDENVSILDMVKERGFLNVSGITRTTLNNSYINIPVSAGDVIKIGGRTSDSYYYYVTRSKAYPDVAIDFAEGFGARQRLSPNTTVEFTIPSDGSCLVIPFGWDDRTLLPTSLEINGIDMFRSVSEKVESLNERVTKVSKDVQPAVDLAQNMDVIYDNLIYGRRLYGSGGGGLVKSTDSDGNLHFSVTSGAGTNTWCWFGLYVKNGAELVKGHQYFYALDLLVSSNSLTEGGTTAAGNNNFNCNAKKTGVNPPLGSGTVMQGVVTGTRGVMTGIVNVTDSTQAGNYLFIQMGKYSATDYLDMTVYDACMIDLGEVGDTPWDTEGYGKAFEKMTLYGFIDKLNAVKVAVNAETATSAKVAESIKSLSVGSDIDIWGDSLTAQGWGTDLARITGRNVYSHGYGGRTSTFIRDQFLAGMNKDRTNIFWVGRNNVTRYESVIEDVKTMVNALGTQKFIVMSVLNGSYEGEYRGQSAYAKFVTIGERLKQIFPDNYVDIRTAIIQGWECGNVKLLSPFVQPAVGTNVQINVSDAAFLTTLNSYDVTYIGEEIMNKIRIGLNGEYDVYSIVSFDDETHITVKLETIGRIQSGQTVANAIDPNNNATVGTSSSVEYLKVMQNGDYVCINDYDTTPSTSRSDRIHQSPEGRAFTAKVIARALEARKL